MGRGGVTTEDDGVFVCKSEACNFPTALALGGVFFRGWGAIPRVLPAVCFYYFESCADGTAASAAATRPSGEGSSDLRQEGARSGGALQSGRTTSEGRSCRNRNLLARLASVYFF